MAGVRVGALLDVIRSVYPHPADLPGLIQAAGIGGLLRRRTDQLSAGQSQRVRFAIAVSGNPQLLVLDEPTVAMDVEAREAFWTALGASAASGRTILFSTHYLEEADAHADRIVVLRAGRIVADGTPGQVKAAAGHRASRPVPVAQWFSRSLPATRGRDCGPDRRGPCELANHRRRRHRLGALRPPAHHHRPRNRRHRPPRSVPRPHLHSRPHLTPTRPFMSQIGIGLQDSAVDSALGGGRGQGLRALYRKRPAMATGSRQKKGGQPTGNSNRNI